MTLQEAKDAAADWAAQRQHVVRAWVFGSYCKGTARSDSDLDVAVEFDIPHEQETPLSLWMADIVVNGVSFHLVRFRGDFTPIVKAALQECSILVFDRAKG